MSREDPQFKLRMTEELRDQIAEAAKANNRSMNAEIVARLERTLTAGYLPAGDDEVRSLVASSVKSATKQLEKAQERALEGLERKIENIVKMTLESAAKKTGGK